MKKTLLLLLILPMAVSAYTSPGKPGGFVNDFAQILSPQQRQTLEEKIIRFEKETSNEIAVATVPTIGNDYIENYAVELFQEWGVGKKENDNGILILIAANDRQMRIEVGYGLEGALTDGQAAWIIQNVMRPAFQQGDYYEGINAAVDKIISATKGEYVPSDNLSQEPSQESIDPLAVIFFVFIGLSWIVSILARSKSWWGGGIAGGIVGLIVGLIKGFIFAGLVLFAILIPLGLLLDYFVSKRYQTAKDTGYYPWWIGGRRGFGGGGRGFGGFGGGGSGGGGSSGSW